MRIIHTIVFLFFSLSAHAELEDLRALSKGNDKTIEWSLYLGPKESEVFHILLIIKNAHSKFIELEGLETSNFSFKDSTGKSFKILEIKGFRNIHYGAIIMTQVTIKGDVNPEETYFFDLNGKKSASVPIKISAVNIKIPHK